MNQAFQTMSFYTDFLIATEAAAPEVAAAELPTEQWPGFSVKSITELDLANVWSLLSREPDAVALQGRFEYLCFDEESCRTVSKVPRSFLELIYGLMDSELPDLAARWAIAEEFRGLRDRSELEELLRNLRELASRARTESAEILVCISGS